LAAGLRPDPFGSSQRSNTRWISGCERMRGKEVVKGYDKGVKGEKGEREWEG